jgi:hypothetical protein
MPTGLENLWGDRPLPEDALPLDDLPLLEMAPLTQILSCVACGASGLTEDDLAEHPLTKTTTALIHRGCPKGTGLSARVKIRLYRPGRSIRQDSPGT